MALAPTAASEDAELAKGAAPQRVCGLPLGSGVGPLACDDPNPKANLRVFIEKISRRRKRIHCSYACRESLRSALLALSTQSATSGTKRVKVGLSSQRVPYTKLKEELLRKPPQGVPPTVLRELVDVARAYDSRGDGCVGVVELLDGALALPPGTFLTMQPFCPLLAWFLWFMLAPAVYCPIGGWSFLDAMYFAATNGLTVGQAEVSLENDGLKLWTACYVFLGAGIVAWVWMNIGVWLVLKYEALLNVLVYTRDTTDLLAAEGHGPESHWGVALEDLVAASSASRRALKSEHPTVTKPFFAQDTEDADLESSSLHLRAKPSESGAAMSATRSAKARRRRANVAIVRVTACALIALAIIAIGALTLSTFSSDVSLVDAIYWSVLTCTTVGGGGLQLTPLQSRGWRAFVLVFVLVAIPSCVLAALGIAEIGLKIHATRIERDLKARKLPVELVADLDTNGVGVSKLEFLCAMLMAADKVSAHELWQILDEFRQLDFHGSGIIRGPQLAILRYSEQERTEVDLLKLHGADFSAAPVVAAPVSCDVETTLDLDSRLGPGLEAPKPNMDGDGGGHEGVKNIFAEGRLGFEGGGAGGEDIGANGRGHGWTGAEGESRSAVHFAPDVVDEASSPLPKFSGAPTKSSIFDTNAVFHELYQDNLGVRRQLDRKDNELVAALRAHQKTEALLRQVYAERQALHGEMMLYRQKADELQLLLDEQKSLAAEARRGREEAERSRAELEVRCRELERVSEDAEQRCSEAIAAMRQRGSEADVEVAQARSRIGEVERNAEEHAMMWKSSHQQCELDAERKLREMSLHCAEIDMQRRGEIRSAMLELKAVTQGQQFLRTELRRSQHPPLLSRYLNPTPPLNLEIPKSHESTLISTGNQPWEVWESKVCARDYDKHAKLGWESQSQNQCQNPTRTALLTGRVGEHAALLDNQVRRLEARLKPEDVNSTVTSDLFGGA